MSQISLFDLLQDGDPEKTRFMPKKSTDWKWRFSDYPQEKNGLTVFSCFACGGGSTMGYKLAGCDVIGCCEIDKRMNDIYIANHSPKHNYLMDIRDFNELPAEQIPSELFNLDILDGSPPCTTFSTAGQREKSWGKKKKFREGQVEQTLDDLSFVFIKTVSKLKPKVVIMENVEGLLLGAAVKYVHQIYRDFRAIGYKVHHWLLKGETMGVPQMRHRVFFIAVRDDIEFDISDISMDFNYEPVTYGEIKEGVPNYLKHDSVTYAVASKADDFDKDIADTRMRIGEKPSGFQTKYIRKNDIVPTQRCKIDLIDLEDMAFVSKETVRNAQTFPRDYNFVNFSNTNVGYICGMSVPPLMIKRIVTRLIESGVFSYKN